MTDTKKRTLNQQIAEHLDAAGLPEYAWEIVPGLPEPENPYKLTEIQVPRNFTDATTLLAAVEAWKKADLDDFRRWKLQSGWDLQEPTVETVHAYIFRRAQVWDGSDPHDPIIALARAFLAALDSERKAEKIQHPTIHRHKTPPESFQDILNQHQEYYLSKDPHRVFTAGDTLIFYEWDPFSEDDDEDEDDGINISDRVTIPPRAKGYTGRSCPVTITYVVPHTQSSWLKPGVVMLGIALNDATAQLSDGLTRRV